MSPDRGPNPGSYQSEHFTAQIRETDNRFIVEIQSTINPDQIVVFEYSPPGEISSNLYLLLLFLLLSLYPLPRPRK
jgi:hypothetical protein